MKTNFITDSFSTLSGLASVAYGGVDFFREVQDQIIRSSRSLIFDLQRPSDILLSYMGSDDQFLSLVIGTLEQEYENNENFSDYVDSFLGPDWVDKVSSFFLQVFKFEVDSSTDYNDSFKNQLQRSLEQFFPTYDELEELSGSVERGVYSEESVGTDVKFVSSVVNNNPVNKIYTPPPDQLMALDNSIELDSDFRGVPYSTGYLTPQDYYSGYSYPNFTDAFSTTTTLNDSVSAGYYGYVPEVLLESSFNPVNSESLQYISDASYISTSENWNESSSISSLIQTPGLSPSDADVYYISLIGAKLNGFTSYNPATMSNADLIDLNLVPKVVNEDKEFGLPMSSRSFSNVF